MYYQAKPWLPWPLRLAFRRQRAARLRASCVDSWPINESSSKPPPNWPGWPEGKRFALVLTHDVETSAGLGNCKPLLDLERNLGLRSCFNFVPEGEYRVSKDLREWIVAQGFEVGVHDLRHDGKLYRSREWFRSHAKAINQWLREWNAVGFRSAFMLHEVDWLHDLNILYDSSTFDTDPFEPQPDGVNTIFPFWAAGSEGGGYVELPYTLVQDFTLFVVLRERSSEIWKRKIDWIAQHGGMALLDTHPDYMVFPGGQGGARNYPAEHYREFLEYVTQSYSGQFWHPLPKEMAAYVSGMAKEELTNHRSTSVNRSSKKIWIDLDNTPHVPFFLPIAAELRLRGHDVVVTARDAFQVCELADFHRLEYTKIGRHYGKNKLAKVLGLFFRAFQLVPFSLRQKPALGLSHGSRAQMIACNLLRIPTILIADYEHAQTPPFMRPKWELAPESIPEGTLHCRDGYSRKYSGIKEDVYAWTLVPEHSILQELGLDARNIIALVRPPATEAHYHNPESEILFEHAMVRLCQTANTRIILLPRNRRQEQQLREKWPHWFDGGRVIVPKRALNGLNLIWHADLVISGGGTMNRESAALGVPVYSVFRGPIGAVDRHLQAEGRLTLLQSIDEIDEKVAIQKRNKNNALLDGRPRKALREIVDHIEAILALEEQGVRSMASGPVAK